MSSAYDVIVVGVGAMGAATCLAAAGRGLRVLGLDQFNVPNSMGSSHGHSRIVRLSYYEHADYVPLLRRSFDMWKRLEADARVDLLHLSGALYLGTSESELISGSLSAADQHQLPYTRYSHEELRKSYPQFSLPEDFVGMMDEIAGWVNPEKAVGSMVTQALKHGAEIHGCEPVVRWSESPHCVSVITTKDIYQAEQVIFCGGPWTTRLVAELGVPLTVTRQAVGWVWPTDPTQFQEPTFPTWALALPDESLYYGTPMSDEIPGLKLGHHKRVNVVDPDLIDRDFSHQDEADFRPALEQYLPQANGPLLSTGICMYTNSPDSHFILDRLPNRRRASAACGFSGHGFKFAPVIGEAMADLALSGASELPIQFLGLSRFTGARHC